MIMLPPINNNNLYAEENVNTKGVLKTYNKDK
jgi:hypothetical protein